MKKLIGLISSEGKDKKQLAKEVHQAFLKYQKVEQEQEQKPGPLEMDRLMMEAFMPKGKSSVEAGKKGQTGYEALLHNKELLEQSVARDIQMAREMVKEASMENTSPKTQEQMDEQYLIEIMNPSDEELESLRKKPLLNQEDTELGEKITKKEVEFDFDLRPYPTFGSFLRKNWWFLLLAFAKAFNTSDNVWGDFLALIIGILLAMYIYWLLRYGISKGK